MGHNNYTKQYETTWCDSLSTAIFQFEDGKTMTRKCRFDDPIKGPAVWRAVTRFKNDHTTELDMYLAPRGK